MPYKAYFNTETKEYEMLIETVNKTQSDNVEIHGCTARVGDTGLPGVDSANLGVRRQAQARIQRMRRRHQRAALSGQGPTGWVARMF